MEKGICLSDAEFDRAPVGGQRACLTKVRCEGVEAPQRVDRRPQQKADETGAPRGVPRGAETAEAPR